MLQPSEFKSAILAIDALGATPAILAKVLGLARDPGADVSTICDLLRHDGALCADIIRISNSPLYAPASPNGNLASAVNQLGMREVIRVVDLSLSRQLFARDLPSYGLTARDYWSTSAAAALVMEALAKELGLHAEDAHTIGILHPIGRVLIDQVILEKGFTLYWEASQPIEDWERDAVGFDFAEAGALLLNHWAFPAATCDAVRSQLDAGSVSDHISLPGALQFTSRLLAATGWHLNGAPRLVSESDPFLEASRITQDALDRLVSDCREKLSSLRTSLSL